MTRQDRIKKWAQYALAFAVVCLLERGVLARYPLLGVIPVLMPIASVAVAFLEGPFAGAVFGAAAGLACNAAYFGSHGAMCLFLALVGAAVGLVTQYGLTQSVVGYLICSAGVLALLDLGRIAVRLLDGRAQLPAMLRVAGLEILWSLCLAPLVYLLFRAVRRRVARWE